MKVVYFGTPSFSARVLSYLLEQGVNIVAVVSKPDRPQGRSSTAVPTPVKQIALAHNPPLPVYQPNIISAPENADLLRLYNADLFVVVAYGEIIKQHLLDMPKMACINLHASLLPKYRGAAPIQRCLINGDTETGVTIMHMVKKMDAGDIIAMEKVAIGPDMTYGELEDLLCRTGSSLLEKTIRSLANGTAARTPQNHELATLAPKIELDDTHIDWRKNAPAIHNLVRGTNPEPCAWCEIELKGQKKRLRVLKTQLAENSPSGVPGNILDSNKKGLLIACGSSALWLKEIQLEGKKAMHVSEFLRGIPEHSLRFLA